jgi:ATP phosphoribosyltransferase
MGTHKEELIIALPKGKLGQGALDIFSKVGYPSENVDTESRKLVYEFPLEKVKYLICRPTDIPTYVEYGAADIGIVGKDSLEESGADVFELVDLGFGYCRFVVAAPQGVVEGIRDARGCFDLAFFNNARVATKFPQVAKNYFREKGIQVEVLKLHGNIELAPTVGLADLIVDIVSTGRTLKENNLIAVEEMFEATARLIANRVSYRIKNAIIQDLAAKCYEQVNKRSQ